MTLELAARLFCSLLALSLIVQTLEFMALGRMHHVRTIWHWSVQKQDVRHTWSWLQRLLARIFSPRLHRHHLAIRLVAAASLFFTSSAYVSIALFASTLLLLIRWRGSFNGGSDFMTIVALTGLVVAEAGGLLFGKDLAWKAALWYVNLQAITSYFVSGSVKLLSAEWRDGRALTYFLDQAIYGPLPGSSIFRRRHVAAACSWAFIIWEMIFPLSLAGPALAAGLCCIAACFHLLVFRYFSLNRFFWAWIVCFPAVIYCSSQL